MKIFDSGNATKSMIVGVAKMDYVFSIVDDKLYTQLYIYYFSGVFLVFFSIVISSRRISPTSRPAASRVSLSIITRPAFLNFELVIIDIIIYDINNNDIYMLCY